MDIRLLSSLIVELNIARRSFSSYPSNHPVISSSLNKVIKTYNRILQHDEELTIAVTRNSLTVRNTQLDKNNTVFRDFAKVLFEHGIGALTLQRGLTPGELMSFNEILGLKREELLSRGGISRLWEETGITSLRMRPIRYDLFDVITTPSVSGSATQPPVPDLWERFAQTLAQSSPIMDLSASGDGAGETGAASASPGSASGNGFPNGISVAHDEIDPQLLASILNRQLGSRENISGSIEETPDLSANAMTCFGNLDPDNSAEEHTMKVPYEKLAIFISALQPELRRQFLKSSFDISTISGESIAEKIIPRLSLEAIAETLKDVRENRFDVQSSIVKLLEKLSENAMPSQKPWMVERGELLEIRKKISSIFREHSSEEFVPESYRKTLDNIITSKQFGLPTEHHQLTELLETIDDYHIENQISSIIVQIMVLDGDPEQNSILLNNIKESFFFTLSTGNYVQLIQLIKRFNGDDIPDRVRECLQAIYASPDTLNEILAGILTWGKSKYNEITELISLIGEQFLDALLDRLAEEETLSIRRFLMERIQGFGPKARNSLFARLSDSRWYVLRNIIIMLRQLDDASVLEHIRPLLSHPNLRVRQEALRTCLNFRDPAAERRILHDLNSSDPEIQLSAINLADKSRSADVFNKLLTIITRSGFNSIECEQKSATIATLAEIGRIEALPGLYKLLASKSFLNARALTKLKIDVIRSLAHYPPDLVQPILTKLAAGNSEIAREARIQLETISGRP